jgi:hypothetical protein
MACCAARGLRRGLAVGLGGVTLLLLPVAALSRRGNMIGLFWSVEKVLKFQSIRHLRVPELGQEGLAKELYQDGRIGPKRVVIIGCSLFRYARP